MDALHAAQMAINAWQKGEAAETYTDFRKLLSVHFEHFSHPFLGSFDGEAARSELDKLMEDQEALINELTFTNIEFFRNGHSAMVMFDARGTAAGGKIYYDGSTSIYFRFDDHGKIVSFKLFTGQINKAWFKDEEKPQRSAKRSETPR